MPILNYLQHGNPAYYTSPKFDVLKLKKSLYLYTLSNKKEEGLEIHTINIFYMLFELKFVILTQHTHELS